MQRLYLSVCIMSYIRTGRISGCRSSCFPPAHRNRINMKLVLIAKRRVFRNGGRRVSLHTPRPARKLLHSHGAVSRGANLQCFGNSRGSDTERIRGHCHRRRAGLRGDRSTWIARAASSMCRCRGANAVKLYSPTDGARSSFTGVSAGIRRCPYFRRRNLRLASPNGDHLVTGCMISRGQCRARATATGKTSPTWVEVNEPG